MTPSDRTAAVGAASAVALPRWVPTGWAGLDGDDQPVVEKATGTQLGTVAHAGPAEVRRAVRDAAAAGPAWAAIVASDRAEVLRRAADFVTGQPERMVELLVREGGATRTKARFEVGEVVRELRAAAELAGRPVGSLLPDRTGRDSAARRIPIGVVAVISPWNMPVLLAIRALAPALVCGNAVVLKPDPRTAVVGGVMIGELLAAAGLPAGVLQVVPGNAATGATLVAEPGVGMVAFTGSTAVGRRIGAVTGERLIRAALELGGNNAFLVLDDADLDAASSGGAWASFLHSGQVCMAAGRHLVAESVADAYIERLVARARALRVGDPWAYPDVDLGPLIDSTQVRRAADLVLEAVAAGARVLTGGSPDGPFFPPTVLTEVTAEMSIVAEEIFAPVAPVLRVADDAEAVALANDTDYGLSASVYTADTRRGRRVADVLDTAVVHVNDQTIEDGPYVPFGGRASSGNGVRFGNEQNLDLFTQWRWITSQEEPTRYPF